MGGGAELHGVLDAASSLAQLVSSDGRLPEVTSVVAPADAVGPYLPPQPGRAPRADRGPRGETTDGHDPSLAPSTVIGTDGREPTADTAEYPWSAVAALRSPSTSCTGVLVGPNVLLTAAHCVFGERFLDDLAVIPGRQGPEEPFGRCGVRRAVVPRRYVEARSPGSDWGLVELDCRVGERTGWLGLRAAGEGLVGQAVVVVGYPLDRARDTQWWALDQLRNVYDHQFTHGGDTYSGQSGAPAFLVEGACAPCVVGVHGYGVGATPDGLNSGARVDGAIVAAVAAVRAERSGEGAGAFARPAPG